MRGWIFSVGLLLTPMAWADWMFLGSTGQKPDRVGIFADILSISGDNDSLKSAREIFNAKSTEELNAVLEREKRFRRVHMLEVYENPARPESRYSELSLDLSQGQSRVVRGRVWMRDGQGQDFSAPDWKKVEPGLTEPALKFLQSESEWRSALRQLLARVKLQKTTDDQSELKPFGYEYVQQSEDEIPDVLFCYVWTDATRPVNNQAKLNQAKADYRLALSQSRLQETERLASEIHQDIRDKEARRPPLAPGSGLRARLESWIGHTEAELVAQQGEPTHFEVNSQGVRCLTYYNERREDIIMMQSNPHFSSQSKVGENVYWWEVTYFVFRGRVYDFALDGNDIPP